MPDEQDVRAAQLALVKQECMPWNEAERVARIVLAAVERRRERESSPCM